jgi:hypothetical protein
MSEKATCGICGDHPLGIRWTDTHGIGACLRCGAPCKVYHYEGDKRVEKPVELLILPEFVALTKQYWTERHRNVAPGSFNFPGSSYEVATEEDFKSANDWWANHRTEVKKE